MSHAHTYTRIMYIHVHIKTHLHVHFMSVDDSNASKSQLLDVFQFQEHLQHTSNSLLHVLAVNNYSVYMHAARIFSYYVLVTLSAHGTR